MLRMIYCPTSRRICGEASCKKIPPKPNFPLSIVIACQKVLRCYFLQNPAILRPLFRFQHYEFSKVKSKKLVLLNFC